MNIKYCGPALDYSGYGEANRHDIAALIAADINVGIELTRHSLEISEFGRLGKLIHSRADIPLDYKIKIIHTTPNIFGRFIEPGKYHIGRVIWETTKLPPDFAEGAKLMDEIWTASRFTANAIKNSGINKPVFVVPEAIDTDIPAIEPMEVIGGKPEFCFYSIFEFTERKNPVALLRAFWQEFENTPGVSLVLKTYVDNFTPEKKHELRSIIAGIKNKTPLKKYAPVFIYNHLMTRTQVYRFHQTFDCFVSPHRGEGWGVGQMEAMLLGKPVISTNCGGIHEWLTNEKDAYLLPCKMVPLVSNSRNMQWYKQDQSWADIDINDLRKAMRSVFEDRIKAKEISTAGRLKVLEKFSLKNVGKLMKERLEQIPLDNHQIKS